MDEEVDPPNGILCSLTPWLIGLNSQLLLLRSLFRLTFCCNYRRKGSPSKTTHKFSGLIEGIKSCNPRGEDLNAPATGQNHTVINMEIIGNGECAPSVDEPRDNPIGKKEMQVLSGEKGNERWTCS